MSLNRYEQLLYDYIESWPEERRFWYSRVSEVASGAVRREEAALEINSQLWEYFEERAKHESTLGDVVRSSSGKLSMLNLSEYLLRIWAPIPRQKPSKAIKS